MLTTRLSLSRLTPYHIQLLNIACFIYIGAWLPISSWVQPDLGIVPWRLIVLFFGILFLRRIPAILVIYPFVPDSHGWREALFCGHFGPMGVGAVFISTLALHKLPEAENPPKNQADALALSIQPIFSFVFLCSILVDGLSIPFFNMGRQVTTLTHTWSRTLRSTGEGPEWLNSTKRMAKPSTTGMNSVVAGSITPPDGGGRRSVSPALTEPMAVLRRDNPSDVRRATSDLEKGETGLRKVVSEPSGEARVRRLPGVQLFKQLNYSLSVDKTSKASQIVAS